MTADDDMPNWPPDEAELDGIARRMLDDLRWVAGRLEQLGDDPEVLAMRREMAVCLSDWTESPTMYSTGVPVVLVVQPHHHLYAPPHRRGTTTTTTTEERNTHVID